MDYLIINAGKREWLGAKASPRADKGTFLEGHGLSLFGVSGFEKINPSIYHHP
jgi:hypothetical protein